MTPQMTEKNQIAANLKASNEGNVPSGFHDLASIILHKRYYHRSRKKNSYFLHCKISFPSALTYMCNAALYTDEVTCRDAKPSKQKA
ncbi:MAG: hypothetical protein WA705_09825 [Candidatus Ozemobacteraceae bacterium]